MAAKTKPRMKALESLLFLEEEEPLGPMLLDMYFELNSICKQYGAMIDLSLTDTVKVYNASGNCRRAIKRKYGKGSIIWRAGKTIELQGFM